MLGHRSKGWAMTCVASYGPKVPGAMSWAGAPWGLALGFRQACLAHCPLCWCLCCGMCWHHGRGLSLLYYNRIVGAQPSLQGHSTYSQASQGCAFGKPAKHSAPCQPVARAWYVVARAGSRRWSVPSASFMTPSLPRAPVTPS